MSPSSGTFVTRVDLALLDQAADDDALLIVDDDLGLRACAPSTSDRARGSLPPRSFVVLLDLEAHRVVARDVRRDVERRASASRAGCSCRSSRRSGLVAPASAAEPPNDRPALYGMLLPTENSAFSLSIAMMCGADRMFVLSWCRERLEQHRVRRDARAEERLRVRQRRADDAADAGRSSAASDAEVERLRASRVCTPPSTSESPPLTGSAAVRAACRCRASLSSWTSRISASMKTWRRGWSSWRITSLIARKSRPLDITISEFVGLSPIDADLAFERRAESPPSAGAAAAARRGWPGARRLPRRRCWP